MPIQTGARRVHRCRGFLLQAGDVFQGEGTRVCAYYEDGRQTSQASHEYRPPWKATACDSFPLVLLHGSQKYL